MQIVYNEDCFGCMVLQIGFSLSRGLHIEATSKGPKGGEIISLGFSFLNHRLVALGSGKEL